MNQSNLLIGLGVLQVALLGLVLTYLHNAKKKNIMNQTELAAALKALTAQQGKIAKEQSDRFDAQTEAIKTLTEAINAGPVNTDVTDALAELKTTTQALDDAIPDPPVV
jgi:hypothetical protein